MYTESLLWWDLTQKDMQRSGMDLVAFTLKTLSTRAKRQRERHCCHSDRSARHRKCLELQGMGANSPLPSAPNSLQRASHCLSPSPETFWFTM